MNNSHHAGSSPRPAGRSLLLEEAIDNLSLGILIFDAKREVVFCNKRYMEIYGLSVEQVTPGTPVSQLIQHRLKLGLKIPSPPEKYIPKPLAPPLSTTTT